MDIKAIVASIISLERQYSVDWEEIKHVSDMAIKNLNISGEVEQINNDIYHFLEDYDVRQKSPLYAETQLRAAESWLKDVTPRDEVKS
jgi:hypothetical protein